MSWGSTGTEMRSNQRGWKFIDRIFIPTLIFFIFVVPCSGEEDVPNNIGNLSGPNAVSAGDNSSNLAAAAGIRHSEAVKINDACREAGFTTAEIQRMFNLMVKAKLAGLPHGDLINKLNEGLAKGAPPEAVSLVLQRRAQALRRAKSLVDTLLVEGWAAADYTVAVQLVGDVLEGGVNASDVLKSVRENERNWDDLPDVRQAFTKATAVE